MAKLKAIKTEKVSMTMETQGMQFNIVMFHARPNKMRTEVEIQGKKQIQAFDGKEGWSVNPFSGRETVEKMDADDIKQMTTEADFDGPLVDYKEKGHTVTLEGEEDIDGSPCYHLKLVTKDNQITHYYIDKDSYLLVLQKSKQKNEDGSESESEMAFSNYKEVNGVMRAHNYEQRASFQGQKFSTPIKVTEYLANTEVPESMFAPPAPGK
jgi:outer membrane lipoprotein-sorting protein